MAILTRAVKEDQPPQFLRSKAAPPLLPKGVAYQTSFWENWQTYTHKADIGKAKLLLQETRVLLKNNDRRVKSERRIAETKLQEFLGQDPNGYLPQARNLLNFFCRERRAPTKTLGTKRKRESS